MPQAGIVIGMAAARQQGPQARWVLDFLLQDLPGGVLEAGQELRLGMKAGQIVGRGLRLPVFGQSLLLPQHPP